MKNIISMTSWPKRIENVLYTLNTILSGTMMPDKIVLNLSKEEFENVSLPDDLVEFASNNSFFEIFWVDGPNTKTFKKLLPTIERYPDDIIITIDDDMCYPSNFVEDLVNDFLKDPSRPITVAYNTFMNVPIPWGGGSLYKAEFLKGYKELLSDEIIATNEDDWFYFTVMLLNNIKLRIASADVCYKPMRYRCYSDENCASYNSEYTASVLSNALEARGTSFDTLCDNIYEKYKNSL